MLFRSDHMLSGYYEGKKATPADIANDLPVSRPTLEKELIDSVHKYSGHLILQTKRRYSIFCLVLHLFHNFLMIF